MSVRVMAWVWEYAQVSGGSLIILLALADFAHDDGTGAYPSIKTLSAKARLGERQTQNVLSALQGLGLITISYRTGPNGVNVYHVVVNPDAQSVKNPPTLKERVFSRDDGKCVYCGKEASVLDHKLPVALGGKTTYENLVAACPDCNTRKGALHPARFTPRKDGEFEVQPEVQEGVYPIAPNPSIELSRESPVEPSRVITLPLWWNTLGKDASWGLEVDEDFIRDIDSFFGHLDLGFQARKMVQWLKDTVKGKKRKDIRRTWLNWCEKADREATEQGEGRKDAPAPKRKFGPLALTGLERGEEAVALWSRASDVLRGRFPIPSWHTWFSGLVALGFINGSLVLKAPSAFVAEYLWKRTIGSMEDATDCAIKFHIEAREE